MPPASRSTGVAITNPLVLYRSLVATKRLEPDPAQHRLAIHLQKLYERLKDYEPTVEYGHRLNQISRALSNKAGNISDGSDCHGPSSDPKPLGIISSLFEQKRERESLALTRVLTSHEAALQLESPRGLMLHGEVGTGKSMLVDLFAECLPNRRKKRCHFTTFMLETMAKLEQLRRSRQMTVPSSLGLQDEYSLLWLAREMISSSPILFLDEFQLPDRAASKIMTNLMTSFFHLGGVLIATSNRMPEELAKAAGIEFAPPPSRLDSITWRLRRGDKPQRRRPNDTGDFAAFLEVLKARCEVWELENGQDYRRMQSEKESTKVSTGTETVEELKAGKDTGLGATSSQNSQGVEATSVTENILKDSTLPRHYYVAGEGGSNAAQRAFAETVAATVDSSDNVMWTSTSITVYGRQVSVPRTNNRVALWKFDELCVFAHGPADFITLASTFHTFIITDVPVLNLLQKNEARRFITLLDALYEARCKLIIQAEAGPDDIFFPETPKPTQSPLVNGYSSKNSKEVVDQDAVYSETLSEVYQDATAPFRPNVSMYDSSSPFGSEPEYIHSRMSGLFSNDQLEDGPPNRLQRGGSTAGFSNGQLALSKADQGGPDFSRAGIFTGEDEKFAYKRARSRLWEMCGSRWWARNEEDWWQPMDKALRTWEHPSERLVNSLSDNHAQSIPNNDHTGKEGMGPSRDVTEKHDEVLFRHGASPFRTAIEPPPKFQWTHIWGMMKWGKKAGAWGQGIEGLKDRWESKRIEKENHK